MQDVRARVVAEARSWIGTPYAHLGGAEQVRGRQLKGVCIDCAQLLIEVYAAAGVIAWFATEKYPPDWFLHQDDERYLAVIQRFADELAPGAPILPADVVTWRYGRAFSHGGIVSAWPHVVHAFAPYRLVDESDVSRPSDLTLLGGRPRPMRVFRPRAFARLEG